MNTIQARPLVTFAIFAYNQEQYIREAVEGAFAQTYEPLEIILSDDCSSDQTYQIMQEMAAAYCGCHEVRVRQNKVNLGFANHINTVVSHAAGKYIVWAAGDDVSLPPRVEALISPYATDPTLVGTFSDIEEIDINSISTGRIRSRAKQTCRPSVMDVIKRRFSVNTQSHCFAKSAFTEFPPLNSDLTYEAPCMTLREILVGRVQHVPLVTVKYRIGSGVSTYDGNNIERLKRLEPAKVADWWRSSAQQMLDDLNFHQPYGYAFEKAVLQKRIIGAARLRDINLNSFRFLPTFTNLITQNFARESWRAFLRRNLPYTLWQLLKGRT